jgi:hypothetical protein
MKKFLVFGFGVLILGGCSENKNTTSVTNNASSISTTEVISSQSSESQECEETSLEELSSASFENTTLTTPEGIFNLTGSKSNESEDGDKSIFVTFDYENTTDENQNIEFLIWDYFDAKQVFPDTTETLNPLMYMDDFEYYDLYEKTQVEINPGATVQAGYGFLLKDADYPLLIDFMENPKTQIGRIEYSY